MRQIASFILENPTWSHLIKYLHGPGYPEVLWILEKSTGGKKKAHLIKDQKFTDSCGWCKTALRVGTPKMFSDMLFSVY